MDSSLIKQLTSDMGGEVLYWNYDSVIECFLECNFSPKKGCLYFVFSKIIDEEELLEKNVACQGAGIVIHEAKKIDIEKWANSNIGVIKVPDMLEAYYAAAKFKRQHYNVPTIEVIGSSGKTTTKDLIGAILREKLKTHIGFENYNAPSGVAYNLFRLNETHEACVLEAGMQGFGIIDKSSEMIKPDIGVVTCIHRAHMIRMGSIENIIKAKAEILKHLSEQGMLLMNGDDENCRRFPLEDYKGKVYKFGISENNDIWASNIEVKNGKTLFKARGKDFEIDCSMDLFGKYNITNALAAVFIGLKLGVSQHEIIRALKNFKTPWRRQQILEGKQNTTIIFDNYNANPDSTGALIDELPAYANGRPLILVLGDMERADDKIGYYAKQVHFSIGEEAAKIGFHSMIAIGKWAEEYITGAKSKGVSEAKMSHFKEPSEAKEFIQSIVIPNSIIVFKASMAYMDLGILVAEFK